MKPVHNLACTLVLFFACNVASATVMFYTDRTSFENSINASQTVDFESGVPDASLSVTIGDATFVSTTGSLADGGVHRTDAGTFGGTSTRLAAQNFGGIHIDLAPGHFAIGMDVGELLGTASGQFTLMSASSGLLDSRIATVGYFGDSPGFVGWVSTEEIGSLEFFIVARGEFETIDNVILGEARVANAPVPATVALFALGLAGVGFARRARAG